MWHSTYGNLHDYFAKAVDVYSKKEHLMQDMLSPQMFIVKQKLILNTLNMVIALTLH